MNIFFNSFQLSVALHIETRHDSQCKPNDCFYVKYNIKLKYNNTTPFLPDNYLLKCAQAMLDVFSTENLSIYHKIFIGIKDQFDLHKFLSLFYEYKTCTLQLIFLLVFFFCFTDGEGRTNSYFD